MEMMSAWKGAQARFLHALHGASCRRPWVCRPPLEQAMKLIIIADDGNSQAQVRAGANALSLQTDRPPAPPPRRPQHMMGSQQLFLAEICKDFQGHRSAIKST